MRFPTFPPGVISNLSSSFSKWRKDKDGKGHNASSISDKSSMSYMSFEKSSIMSMDQPDYGLGGCGTVPDYVDLMNHPDMTPKVMRKRKAEEEAVPFSASKK